MIQNAMKIKCNDWIFEQTKGIVQSGPFKDMVVLHEEAWNDGNLGTKLLGCYEQELHDIVEKEIARLNGLTYSPIITVLGCAEGYYAIGLARRVPKAAVNALDISKESIRIALDAAKRNEVNIRTVTAIDDLLQAPDFVVCDCEGAEVQYLDPAVYPALKRTRILVECHDCVGLPVTETLANRFGATHEMFVVIEGARNPNEFPMLRPRASEERWLAVSEGRPCMMHWMFMEPK